MEGTRTMSGQAYALAVEQYAALGVAVEPALERLEKVPLSVHCWQGDDVAGFERPDAALAGGGIMVTGAHPGRARNPEELRVDLDKAYSLIPGRHRLNLHASYGEFSGAAVDRDAIEPEHFQGWIDWAKARGLGLDFNATLFSHPKAASGFTLSDRDRRIRHFWIEHVQRCRMISEHMGRALRTPCLHNLWIPDGSKEVPIDRRAYRAWLRASLDEIYETEYNPAEMKDAVEGKLFGIGSESFVVGSHDFYFGFASKQGLIPCLDLGHFHPTESVPDKLSAMLQFYPEVLVHVSRGVRWDSDHVVILNDELRALAEVIVRCQAFGRVHLATDYFDASINRVGAWVIGARATLKALLLALLEPYKMLKEAEESGDNFARLALQEEAKALPFGAVWDEFCSRQNVPSGAGWIADVQQYGAQVEAEREGKR
jgi:L-rhamnose isomerase